MVVKIKAWKARVSAAAVISRLLLIFCCLITPLNSASNEKLDELISRPRSFEKISHLIDKDNCLFDQYKKNPNDVNILKEAIPSCLDVLAALYEVPKSSNGLDESDGTISVNPFIAVTENNLYELIGSFLKNTEECSDISTDKLDAIFMDIISQISPKKS